MARAARRRTPCRPGLRILVLAAVLGAPLAQAATVFRSPLNDGGEGAPIAIPATNSPVALNLWIRPTPLAPLASAPGKRCSGTADPNGTGDEICMWDVYVQGTGDVVFDGFVPAADVVGHIDSSGVDPLLRVNGGDSVDPDALPVAEPIGVLTVSAPPGGSGEVQVVGNLWVTSLLTSQPIDGTPGALPLGLVDGDADADSVPDGLDNCPDYANESQADIDSDGIGDDCTCGDSVPDGIISVLDVQQNQNSVLGLATPLPELDDCSGDGIVSVLDVQCTQNRVLGLISQCAMTCDRMPSVRTGIPACP